MIKIYAAISNGRGILAKKTESGSTLVVSEAPTLIGAQRKLKKTLRQISPYFEFYFEKQLYSNSIDENHSYILYHCEATAYTDFSSSSEYYWVSLKDIPKCNLVDLPDDLLNSFKSYYFRICDIHIKLREEIIKAHDQSIVSLEFTETMKSLGIFIKTPTYYCTFSFWVVFEFDGENVDYKIHWCKNKSYAPGDISDLNILFLETLAIVIKLFLHEPVYISMYCNEIGEIYSGGLVFEAEEHSGTLPEADFVEKIFFMFELFNITMGIHGHLIGSISNNLADTPDPAILSCLNSRNANYVCREEHACYYDEYLECITIKNNIYDCDELLKGYSFEVLNGIHGKLLIQKSSKKSFINYIDNKDWERLQKIISKRNINSYQLLCQSNKLYLLTQQEIWVVNGLFHHSLAESEREEILIRNNRERALLFANRSYGWKYPIDAGRFEHLIADLLSQTHPEQRVRLMGDCNNADGGRDILLFKPDNTLTICQCKAYQKNIGKHNVTDIRDTLDHYGANGFFLSVSEGITTHLIDHLCVLKQKYSVDWWSKREIFSLLRQHPHIADSYADILEIKND